MKKSVKIFLGVIVLLIIARLLLPYFVLKYLNKTLADLDGYTGHVDDVDISLYRGAYQIDNLNIRKVNGKIEKPFVLIPKMDLSVQWKAIFDGKLVAEVVCYQPEINFAFSDGEGDGDPTSQTGAENDWTQTLKDLLPIDINKFEVVDGTVNLTNIVSQPATDLSMKNFQVSIANIRNVIDDTVKLPSPVTASGDLPGIGGKMDFKADMQLLKEMPDFRYYMKINNMQLVKLNPLAMHYAGIDFDQGTLDLVSEMKMEDGNIKGYLKPLTHNMKIFEWNEGDNRSVTRFVKELLAEGANKLLENKTKDQLATRIPLQGRAENVGTSIWPIIINVLRNGYVSALTDTFDNTLSVKDAWNLYREDRREQRQERKEDRKEERQEKREERQEKRAERKAERAKN